MVKSFLLNILKKGADFLTRTKLHRLIPHRRELYDIIFQRLWDKGEVLEIQ